MASMDSEQSQFNKIAQYYDALMECVPYKHWVGFVLEVVKRAGLKPQNALDLACGTGTVSELLLREGFNVVGVDISPQMILAAKRKAAEKKLNIEYHIQDAAHLSLGRSFDLVVSLFDSINYITDPCDLQSAFQKVNGHMRSGGLFIFDVNTEYALSHGFFNQSNIGTFDYPRYVWTSTYDRSSRLCRVDMVFEVMEPNGSKRQFTEVHLQRAYRLDELESMLKNAGFDATNVYDNFSFRPPKRRTDRAVFAAKKP